MPALYRRGLAVAGAALLFIHLAKWLPAHLTRTDTATLDFPVYQGAAQRLVRQEPVYVSVPRAARQPPTTFLYPPPLLAVARPFAFVDPRTFQTASYVMVLLGFWASAAGLARIAREPLVTGTLAFGVMLAPLTVWPMSFGNVELVVWALVIWGFAIERATATFLVLGAAIKLYPVIPLAVLLVRRPGCRRQALLTSAAVAAGTLLMTGADVFREWWQVGLPSLSAAVLHPGNISLTTALLRPFGFDVLPAWTAWILLGLPPPLIVGAIVGLRRHEPSMHAALSLLAGVLLAPLCWVHQLALALLPGALWLRSRRQAQDLPPGPPVGR